PHGHHMGPAVGAHRAEPHDDVGFEAFVDVRATVAVQVKHLPPRKAGPTRRPACPPSPRTARRPERVSGNLRAGAPGGRGPWRASGSTLPPPRPRPGSPCTSRM